MNLHGALIHTALGFSVGQKIQIEVFITGKKAEAEVVWSDPEKPLTYGIALLSHRTSGGLVYHLTTGEVNQGTSGARPGKCFQFLM